VTGGVTQNTLAAPVPVIAENIHTAKNGNVSGTVNTSAAHNFQISGYVNTSAGSVTTTVSQSVKFSNDQTFKITSNVYQQDINQNTVIHSTVSTVDSSGRHKDRVNYNWPMTMDIGLVFNSDGTVDQTTAVNQYFERDEATTLNGQAVSFNLVQNRVTPTDTLEFDSSFNLIGNMNQSSAQTYFGSDSSGYCYSRSIAAANNVLTSISNGVGCK
jgi:hypothetical protein